MTSPWDLLLQAQDGGAGARPLYGNIVKFLIVRANSAVYTDEATLVNQPSQSAILNGYIEFPPSPTFPVGTNVIW